MRRGGEFIEEIAKAIGCVASLLLGRGDEQEGHARLHQLVGLVILARLDLNNIRCAEADIDKN